MFHFKFIFKVLSFSQAYADVNDMLDSSKLVLTKEVESKPITFEDLSALMRYTFPPEINCFTVANDGSPFGEEVQRLVYRLKKGPQLVNDPSSEIFGCTGFVVTVKDQFSLEPVVKLLGRNSEHRIMCLIETGNLETLGSFLKKENLLFGEAEASLFLMNDLKKGYKLAHPLKAVEAFVLKGDTAWEKNMQRIKNFEGRRIVIMTANCSVFVRIGDIKRDGTTDLFRGFEAKILDDIAGRLNFTYSFAPNSFELPLGGPANASGPGLMLESVATGRADMAFCGFWHENKYLRNGIESSRPVQSLCITYLVPRPPPKNASWKIVLTPFDKHLWMLITGTVIGFSALIKCASFLSRRFLGDPLTDYESFEYNMLIVFGILSATSWPNFRQLLSPLKHLISWWILFSILLNNCYSSTLISNLYTPQSTGKPSTIDDLVNGGYLWRTEIRFAGESLWDLTESKYNRWMSRQRILPPNSTLEAMGEDLYSKQAVVGAIAGRLFFPLSVTKIPKEYFTDYEVMDTCVARVYETYFFSHGSSLLHDFNACLSDLIETGIVEHYRNLLPFFATNFPTKFLDKPLLSSDVHPISFSHISGIFGILGYGYLISLCILVIEVLHSRLTTSLVKKKELCN